ncbi:MULTISPECIES: hypothetical protein [Legionella]|uniref:Uncharacterized protein n=1 Tax=Legionella drozanskii LLAP-1 TaxID=1212489 RepID=A0A0W0SXB5_9GAMM|nr:MULTISPECIES: hypothetical protein [Legionella]KTC87999.1 hypothetical protein Ldro_1618 [Legionella drozanskii LLAP-1]PJE07326.1 MAG: hypothetical protein CK430_14000 [Legionella sp.]
MTLRKLLYYINLRKLLYYTLILLFTAGASLIIAFLSFTGLLAIVSALPLAISCFFLSGAYEGEIYLQGIKGALNKLYFKPNYLMYYLANEYLLKLFAKGLIDTSAENCPQYFKDYETLVRLLHKFDHKHLDEASKLRKKQIEKTLRDMEKWFAVQLFSLDEDTELTRYASELRACLRENGQAEVQALLQSRQKIFNGVKIFSVLAGIFMSLGTTYLLVDAFAVLPILAAISITTLPAIIIPLAILAGAAYTFLIYNAVTDMINNDSLRKGYSKVRKDLDKGITVRSVTIAVSAVVLLSLTVALTVCTAGTWWTVAKHTRPLYAWMGKIPNIIASGIALITGIAQLFFNLENVITSLKLIRDAFKAEDGFWKRMGHIFSKEFKALRNNENLLQLLNLPRLILLLTFVPLRLILFLGHLISIAVSSDRVPGIPETVSTGLGFTSEFFEDLHFFLGDLFHSHKHGHDTKSLIKERLKEGHGHDHSTDIPTQLLKLLFFPLFYAAAGWDWAATRLMTKPQQECDLLQMDTKPHKFKELALQGKSAVILHNDQLYYADVNKEKVTKIKSNETNQDAIAELKSAITEPHESANAQQLDLIFSLTGIHNSDTTLSWDEALRRQTGKAKEESITFKKEAKQSSAEWKVEHSAQQISKYIDKHLSAVSLDPQGLASGKIEKLKQLRSNLLHLDNPSEESIKDCISADAETNKDEFYNKQRHDYSFFRAEGNTRTQTFLEKDLPQRIGAPAA